MALSIEQADLILNKIDEEEKRKNFGIKPTISDPSVRAEALRKIADESKGLDIDHAMMATGMTQPGASGIDIEDAKVAAGMTDPKMASIVPYARGNFGDVAYQFLWNLTDSLGFGLPGLAAKAIPERTFESLGLSKDYILDKPDTTIEHIAAGAGSLVGFIGMPAKIVGKALMKLPVFAKKLTGVRAVAQNVAYQMGVLGIASGLVNHEGLLEEWGTDVGVNIKNRFASMGSGAMMGAVFGGSHFLQIPKMPLLSYIMRLGVGGATLDMITGKRPWDERELLEKVYDYGLTAWFLRRSMAPKHFLSLKKYAKEVEGFNKQAKKEGLDIKLDDPIEKTIKLAEKEGLIERGREGWKDAKVITDTSKVEAEWDAARREMLTEKLTKDGISKAEAKIDSQIFKEPKTLADRAMFVEKLKTHVMYQLVDRWQPIHDWVAKISKFSGINIPIEKHPYFQVSLYAGREGSTEVAVEGLRNILKPFQGMKSEKDIVRYLLATHNVERAKKKQSNPQGITVGDAEMALKDLRTRVGSKKYSEILEAGEQFWKWADTNILTRLVDAEVSSPKDRQNILKGVKHWLPFDLPKQLKGLEEAFNLENRRTGERFDIKQNVLYKAEGMAKEAKITHPLESVLRRLTLAVNLAEKNKVLRSFVKLAEEYPEFGKDIRLLKEPKRGEKGERPPPGYGEFGVIYHNKVFKYTAPEDVIMSLKQINQGEFRLLDRMFGKFSSIMRAGTTTYYLPFSISNLFRDLQMAFLTSRYNFNPKIWLKGFSEAFKYNFGLPNDFIKGFLKAHAGFGGMLHREAGRDFFGGSGSLKISKKQLFQSDRQVLAQKRLNPIHWIKGFSTSLEMASRGGIFDNVMKKTGNPVEAAIHARRSTIDFSRAGQLMRLANRWIPFLNARVQAKVNMADALFGTDPQLKGKHATVKKARTMAAFRATTLIMMPALATYAYNRVYHSKLYDDIPDDTKDKYFTIVMGETRDEKTGKYRTKIAKIPKGDIATILFNPIEKFLDWATNEEPLKMHEVMLNMLSEMLPVSIEREGKLSADRMLSEVLPPPVKASIETITNRNLYWGKPIVPESLQGVDPKEQYTDYTPEFWVIAGKVTGQSPLLMQSYFRGLFGAVLTSPAPGGQLDMLKRKIVTSVGGKTTQQVYDQHNKIKTGYLTTRRIAFRYMKEGNIGRAMGLIQKWNAQAPQLMMEMGSIIDLPYGMLHGGTYYLQNTFQQTDIERLIEAARTKQLSSLERSLGTRFRRSPM